MSQETLIYANQEPVDNRHIYSYKHPRHMQTLRPQDAFIITVFAVLMLLFTAVNVIEFQTGDFFHRENPFERMYWKKLILRDDDVSAEGDPSSSMIWLTNYSIEKGLRVTYGVVAHDSWMRNNSAFIDYLKNLDAGRFEIAAHGFRHEVFRGMPYERQYELIDEATRTIEGRVGRRAYTFLPPWNSDDLNTSQACRNLGYHSISSNAKSPKSEGLGHFDVSFMLESDWKPPVEHHSFPKMKEALDSFLVNDEEYYVFCLHHNTFRNEHKRAVQDGGPQCYENRRFRVICRICKDKELAILQHRAGVRMVC